MAVSLVEAVAVRTAVARTEEDHMVVAHMVAVTSADTDKKSRRNHFGDEMAQSLFPTIGERLCAFLCQ